MVNKITSSKKTPCYNSDGLATASLLFTGGNNMKNEMHSLSHSKYRCQYHIVFAPKFRRKVIHKELRVEIGEIIRKLCEEKKVELIEAEACPDHIHMLVSIPLYLSVAQFVGYLKSKSALMIFDRHADLKYRYGRRNFWARGYSADTVGKNEKNDKRLHKKSVRRGIYKRSDVNEGVYRPVLRKDQKIKNEAA